MLERPNNGVLGEITVEARIAALGNIIDQLRLISDEVHCAILSPGTIGFLEASGLEGLRPKKLFHDSLIIK